MKVIDISWPVSSAMTSYKQDEAAWMEIVKSFVKDGMRESMLHIGTHSGTHVDAPCHFLRDGKTIDELDLSTVYGAAIVVDCTTFADSITEKALVDAKIKKGDIVLLKTTNSLNGPNDSFNIRFVSLHLSGAKYLADAGAKAVGFDYLSIEKPVDDHVAHRELFENGVTIIEGLRLNDVKPGRYTFACFPLNLVAVEAAPARAVLIEE